MSKNLVSQSLSRARSELWARALWANFSLSYAMSCEQEPCEPISELWEIGLQGPCSAHSVASPKWLLCRSVMSNKKYWFDISKNYFRASACWWIAVSNFDANCCHLLRNLWPHLTCLHRSPSYIWPTSETENWKSILNKSGDFSFETHKINR